MLVLASAEKRLGMGQVCLFGRDRITRISAGSSCCREGLGKMVGGLAIGGLHEEAG